jgi:NADPH-dependent ferric siderophore reductase
MPSASPRTVDTVMHPLRARLLEVLSTERIGPRMQRVTVGGAQLEDDFPAPPFAAADHVKLVLPDPETGRIALPDIVDGRLARRPGPAPVFRDYTVRAVGPDGLVLDFVRHDHGPAGRWGIDARVGDPLGVLGPRGSHLYPTGYARYALIADETALPAVGRWLDEPGWEADVEVYALVEQAGEYPLPERPGTRIHWLEHPIGAARRDALVAIAESVPDADDVFVWAAGESGSLTPLRRILRDRGFDRQARDVSGYWRIGVAGADHHDDDED